MPFALVQGFPNKFGIQMCDLYGSCIGLLRLLCQVVGTEGWVPVELHGDAKLLSQELLEDMLRHAESDEEKRQILEHWRRSKVGSLFATSILSIVVCNCQIFK